MLRGTGTSGRRFGAVAGALASALAIPAVALAHLDHPAPSFVPQAPGSLTAQQGGAGAKWEFLSSFATGNPHTDLDFFRRGDKTYVSVGTLGIGPNGGGQSIFQVMDKGQIAQQYVGSAPTASCVSDPSAATGLQHDVEATPKGGTILNTAWNDADQRDAQLLVDATDASGRCHDQGAAGITDAPQGGLEIIDITDPAHPVTIGLTSHIGESHTVNIDPRRPHIAYSVTSDNVGVDAQGKRGNESSAEKYDLDGFEVVDLSSCMNFPASATVEQKRATCRPQVWRYRYPSIAMAQGHTNKTGSNGVFGCHELEVYPDDRLACASGNASILFDLKDTFDDNGTPTNYTDDKVRGNPLPCRVRDSTSVGGFATGAKVTDCVTGAGTAPANDLGVEQWLKNGAPSLAGVKWIGSAFHQGRETTQNSATPDFSSSEDIDFSHEAELSQSGRFLFATDERGGGIAPPGASCSPGIDNPTGNGGIHAYRVDKLLNRAPTSADDAFTSYAKTPEGNKAIFRAQVRTEPQAALCTAHVFQQIPGQNRIFMGWYSQGTRVIDYTENPDGTISFKEAGYFIPENANQWVSAIYRVDHNNDGSFTYYGTSGDFYVGDGGRGTVDFFKVTLPPPPAPAARLPGTGPGLAPDQFLFNRQALRVSRTGNATLRVSCISASPCKGNMVVRTSQKFRRADRQNKTFLIAKRSFNVPAGRRDFPLSLRVSSAGRKLAARPRGSSRGAGVQVKAKASVVFGTGRAFIRTKTLRAVR
ncbi:MAG TPA: hypothetical protein VF517_17575 [Thermoleophilaceae bacterium]|jgi:hypothetical protein